MPTGLLGCRLPCPRLEETLDNADVPLLGGHPQCDRAILLGGIDVCMVVHQEVDKGQLVFLGGKHQGGLAIGLSGVDVVSLVD
jgi:hypothetical protein